jgi:enoyl-CoA hydratase
VLADCCRTAPGTRVDVKRVLHEYYGAYDRMAMDASLAGPEPTEAWPAFGEKRLPSCVCPDLREDGRMLRRVVG